MFKDYDCAKPLSRPEWMLMFGNTLSKSKPILEAEIAGPANRGGQRADQRGYIIPELAHATGSSDF